MNLSPKSEFVYLKDNKLLSMEGIEILKRLNILDLSFNGFKGIRAGTREGLTILRLTVNFSDNFMWMKVTNDRRCHLNLCKSSFKLNCLGAADSPTF